jgi:hypothetical protein
MTRSIAGVYLNESPGGQLEQTSSAPVDNAALSDEKAEVS